MFIQQDPSLDPTLNPPPPPPPLTGPRPRPPPPPITGPPRPPPLLKTLRMPSTHALIRRHHHCANDINYANYQPAVNIIPDSSKIHYPNGNPSIDNSDGPVTLIVGDDDACYYHHNHHLAVGAIIGIVVGVLVIIVIIFFIVKRLRKRGLGAGAGAEGGEKGGPGIVGRLKGIVRRKKGVRGDEEKAGTDEVGAEMGTRMPGRDPYRNVY